MREQSLPEKIAALPAEERATRYLQVVREQGLSMATQKRCLDEKDETIASLRQRVADMTRAVEFARWVIEEGPFSGCDLDGGTVQDKAAELGLIERTTYDPAKHGEGHDFTEPGDDWYVFTAAFLYLLSDEVEGS